MFKPGAIVFYDKLVFKDRDLAVKDYKNNRPCIVLFTTENSEKSLVCSCPLTSNWNVFNRSPESHMFLPCVVYSSGKLNFAMLDNIILRSEEDTHCTGIDIGSDLYYKLMERIKVYIQRDECRESYKRIIPIIESIELTPPQTPVQKSKHK